MLDLGNVECFLEIRRFFVIRSISHYTYVGELKNGSPIIENNAIVVTKKDLACILYDSFSVYSIDFTFCFRCFVVL